MNIKSVFFGWDARDARTVIVGCLFLILTVYFQPKSDSIVSSVLYISSITSQIFTNNLYYTASGYPESGITLGIYFLLMFYGAIFIIRPKFLQKIAQMQQTASPILTGKYRVIFLSMKSAIYLLLIVIYLSVFIYFAFPIIIRNDFYRAINIISPYISENQKLLLISKWSLMHSASDYELIKKSIDASKLSIPLVP